MVVWRGWGQLNQGVSGGYEDSDLVLDKQGLGRSMEDVVKKIVETKEVGKQLDNILELVKTSPTWITRNEIDVAVIISPELFEMLVDAQEQLEDITAVDEASKDKSPGIPWEQIKKNLGLN
jgi:PHD/YefM family antitoxin component YafN of YafNO toxin-antitoxin module